MPRTTKTVEVEKTTYTCDWCGVSIVSLTFDPPWPCIGCGRYGCDDHKIQERSADEHEWGRYCDDCWAIGEPFRVATKDLESSIAWHREAWHQKAAAAAKGD